MGKKIIPEKPFKLTPWLFLLPSILILGTFLIYPILQAFQWSVLDYKLISGTGEFVGLDNFKELFTDKAFWNALINTLLFLMIVLPLNIFLPMVLAVLVNQNLRGVTTFRVLYYLPFVTPMVVGALMWKMLYSQNGMISKLFVSLGVFESPTNLLVQQGTALAAVALITVWKGLGYYMIIYLAGLQSLPKGVYESAEMDGASFFQQFRKITIPMLMPSITLVSILTIIAGMKVFDEIAITTGGGPAGATTTLVIYIYDNFMSLDVSIASAAGLVLLILAIAASVFQMKLTSKREEDLKG